MTRRNFLRNTTATAATAMLARTAATAAAPVAPIPAIDTHIHLYDPTRPQGIPWPPKTDALLYQPHLPETFRPTVAPFRETVQAARWVTHHACSTSNRSSVLFLIGGAPSRMERRARRRIHEGR